MRRSAIVLVLAIVAAGCSTDESSSPPAAATATTTSVDGAQQTSVPAVPSTSRSSDPSSTVASSSQPAVAIEAVPDAFELVRTLAADDLDGRDNETPGSERAQDVLVEWLTAFATPLPGAEGFRQSFDEGTNLIGVVTGAELPDEYVVIGAHYDHLSGVACAGQTVDDTVCNGAADNAAGVAAAISVARELAAEELRRSVVIALWDAEEDGLLGSRHYVGEPLVPLVDTVMYINLDILGSNLLPSLSDRTLVIGAESGGRLLSDTVDAALAGRSIVGERFSVAFGQGRSDHAPFHAAGVPVVFFGDATNGCYHTVDDEIDAIDPAKLTEQIDIVTDVVRRLAMADDAPVFTPGEAPVAFDDAVTLLELLRAGRADLDLLDTTVDVERLMADLTTVVDGGPGDFGGPEVGVAIDAALGLLEAVETGPCPPS